MAAPPKTQKPASRWGFLQQAVASVESRLDTILAEEEEEPKKTTPVQIQPATRENAPPANKRISLDASRSNAGSPANDRLQERLARAMAKKSGSRPESPMPPSEPISRAATPSNQVISEDVPKSPITNEASAEVVDSTESAVPDESNETQNIVIEPLRDTIEQSISEPESSEKKENHMLGLQGLPSPAVSALVFESPRDSLDVVQSGKRESSSVRPSTDSQIREDALSAQLKVEYEVSQARMQEEINGYIERIDALQAKLQYLTKEAIQAAKQASTSAQSGTVQKRLLEKDEKIALLMEEGQKLSVTEMKHLTTIKKLRTQATTALKDHDSVKARAEKAERSLRAMEDRAQRAEAASKRAEQNLSSSLTSTGDVEALTKERNALNSTIVEIKAQLTKANARAEAAESKAVSEQLERERKRNSDLQNDIASAKVERDLMEEKLKREIKDLKAAIEREKEHSRVIETEMLGEQAALESKLESFRARAEEVSTGDHGDTQAKLLRQIETLQSQYAAASQNWQGIEGSLLSRITNVERERDEIASRESDVRKKLRDVSLKAKNAERESEETQSKYLNFEKSQADLEEGIQRVNRKVQQLESDLAKSRQDLEDQKSQAEVEYSRRLDEEKAKWTASLNIQRTESPGTSARKGSIMNFDINHLMSPTHHERNFIRRPSVLPVHELGQPTRQYSTTSFKGLANGSVPETPSIVTPTDPDEYFANVPATPASNSHNASSRGGLNDLISTSTVGTGPSVQLVERMSANVRRLESEKAANKDEILRLTSQRDEARQEVVSLMREAEEKRTIDGRLKALEQEHQDLEQRYQTTLELLGEKSEQVEELKADIIDVKQMYRQLADTMK